MSTFSSIWWGVRIPLKFAYVVVGLPWLYLFIFITASASIHKEFYVPTPVSTLSHIPTTTHRVGNMLGSIGAGSVAHSTHNVQLLRTSGYGWPLLYRRYISPLFSLSRDM